VLDHQMVTALPVVQSVSLRIIIGYWK